MHTYNKSLNQRARNNRCAGNLVEALFWNQLKKKQLGFDFTKQKPIGNYIADFYCKELNLIVELDGKTHEYQIEYDKVRDDYMKSLGIKVIRISNSDVLSNMTGSIEYLKQILEHTKNEK